MADSIGPLNGDEIGPLDGDEIGSLNGDEIGPLDGDEIGSLDGVEIGPLNKDEIGPLNRNKRSRADPRTVRFAEHSIRYDPEYSISPPPSPYTLPWYQPRHQFTAQVDQERGRLLGADQHKNLREAEEIVRKRWVEQGIWYRHWDQSPKAQWKHEAPLKLVAAKPTDEEPLVVVQNLVLELEREASRPYHQFIYQVSKERERIQGEFPDWTSPDVALINTEAYENVKAFWIKQCIWNERWGVLPGMAWKREAPLCTNGTAASSLEPMKSLCEVASLIGANPHWPFSSPVHQSPQGSSRYHNVFFKPTNVASTALDLSNAAGNGDKEADNPKNTKSKLTDGKSEVEILPAAKSSNSPNPDDWLNEQLRSLQNFIKDPDDPNKRLNEKTRDLTKSRPSKRIIPPENSLSKSTSGARPRRKVARSSNPISSAKPEGVTRKLRSSTRLEKGKKG